METNSARVVNISGAQQAFARPHAAASAARMPDFLIEGWVVQPALNRLTRDGVIVRLRPQLVDLLVCLASEPGTVFTRNDLLARVWDGRCVAESGIARCIAELRTVLEDDPHRPRLIETIRKRGYRLVAAIGPARAVIPAPSAPTAPSGVASDAVQHGHAAPRGLSRWVNRLVRRLAPVPRRVG